MSAEKLPALGAGTLLLCLADLPHFVYHHANPLLHTMRSVRENFCNVEDATNPLSLTWITELL